MNGSSNMKQIKHNVILSAIMIIYTSTILTGCNKKTNEQKTVQREEIKEVKV